jgi:hypothetical protein
VNAWRAYWAYWGVPGGLLQCLLVALMAASGAVLVMGLGYCMVLLAVQL